MDNRLTRNLVTALRHDIPGMVLLGLVAMIIVLCAAAPWVTAIDPTATDFAKMLLPPSADHPFGTDDFGRDVFSRLLHGGRVSLMIAAVAVMIVTSIGTVIGILAGYFGGLVDIVLTKVIDVLLAFPRLVLAIAVAALMGGGMVPLIIAVSAVAWPAYARILRAFTLQLRQEGYVLAARTMGTPTWKILLNHIGLNLIGPILVLAMLDLGNLILAISALSFLGLGIAPPQPEWGAMLNEGRAMMELAPWLVLAPGSAIFLVVLAANYCGDIVRDSAEGRPVHGPRNWFNRKRTRAEAPLETASGHQPLIALNNVSVAVTDMRSPFYGRRILEDVSLTVMPGECVGLIGESGSGKSTIASLALGLTRQPLALTGGDVSLFGTATRNWTWEDWRNLRGRSICLVNQDPLSALNPVLRIGEQIAEVMAVHSNASRAMIDIRLREVLADVDLPDRVIDQYPHELSGGMRQRVVIAMGLVNRPALLIADEPTTALDVSTQIRILDLLRNLQARYGLGLLFVSHDLRVVARVADRVVILRNGRIVDQGQTEAVFTRSQEPYTQELMAAIPGQRRNLSSTG